MSITRAVQTITAVIANGEALSGAVPMTYTAGGIVHMPAAWTAADIGFQVAYESGGTFYPLYDNAGDLVEISSPAADNAYEIPAEVYAARFVKLWSQSGGSDVNQGAVRTLVVTMKT